MNRLELTPELLTLPVTDLKHVKREIDRQRHLNEVYVKSYKRLRP